MKQLIRRVERVGNERQLPTICFGQQIHDISMALHGSQVQGGEGGGPGGAAPG